MRFLVFSLVIIHCAYLSAGVAGSKEQKYMSVSTQGDYNEFRFSQPQYHQAELVQRKVRVILRNSLEKDYSNHLYIDITSGQYGLLQDENLTALVKAGNVYRVFLDEETFEIEEDEGYFKGLDSEMQAFCSRVYLLKKLPENSPY